MKTSYRRIAFLCLPLAAASLFTGCVGPAYYADGPYGPDATVYIADNSRPHYYDNYPYYYGGRYYTGGYYQTGNYHYNGHNYSDRYYHNGKYYYGGTRQSRPGNGQNQNHGNPPQHSQSQGSNHNQGNPGNHSQGHGGGPGH